MKLNAEKSSATTLSSSSEQYGFNNPTRSVPERRQPRGWIFEFRRLGTIPFKRVTGDASTREYFRALCRRHNLIIAVYRSAFDQDEPAAERLAKLEVDNPSARLTFANDACAHLEVTRLFLEAKLPVPAVVAVSGPDGAMLIEDLGNTRLQDWLHECSEPEAANAYRRAVELIVRIQETTAPTLSAGLDLLASGLR